MEASAIKRNESKILNSICKETQSNFAFFILVVTCFDEWQDFGNKGSKQQLGTQPMHKL